MNKLPWFTHDNDAHEDLKLRAIMRKYGGPWAYGIWWILIEVLDRHGKGDLVSIEWVEFEELAMTKRGAVKALVGGLHRAGLIQSIKSDGPVLKYEIKKFRERQSKLKSKLPSTLPEPSLNPAYNRREGEEKRKEDRIGTAPSFPPGTPPLRPICRYKDQGQGQCYEYAEDKSKYCLDHKVKVHEMFLSKQDQEVKPSSNGNYPSFDKMDNHCLDCDKKIEPTLKRCDECQAKIDPMAKLPKLKRMP